MCKVLICLVLVAATVFLLTVAKQVKQGKKQREIPEEFTIMIGDVPRWLYRHAYNVSIKGKLEDDRCRVPSELTFNRSMLPADLYRQVYEHTFMLEKWPVLKEHTMDPLNMSFDQRRMIEMDAFFGTEPPYAWIKRGWNYSCQVCGQEFAVESDHILHEHNHYVTNYSATPIMNWTIIQMLDEEYRNVSERYWIDYWQNVSKGYIDPEFDTDTVASTWSSLSVPLICYVCNATIYNTSEYNPHMLSHKAWEEEKWGNVTVKYKRPSKSWNDIHFRKLYVQDPLNTLEEEEYDEAQRILKEASHSLNTDEIMERTKNLSINKRLLEFGVDSRGYTITWPRLKPMPDMSPFNDSQNVGGPDDSLVDPELDQFDEARRKKWEEDFLRRRKAQEKGNPHFASYSVESNETAAERRALNITRRRRKYTPTCIYVRRKRREITARPTYKKPKQSTTTFRYRLLGEKKLRRANSNKRKTKEQVYKQQLAKIIQKARDYMKKYNKTHYPTTQSIYEKVQIYKVKEKFKKLNWFMHGLDNYTVPPDIDIDMITNTPHSTVRALFYKRLEKRDLYARQYVDFKRHRRHINELKDLVVSVEKKYVEMMSEDGDGKNKRKKRFVNFEDINLQEIENALNPLPAGTVPEIVAKKQEIKQEKDLNRQPAIAKKLLFKREVLEHSRLLNEHLQDNLSPKNHFGKFEIEELVDTEKRLLKKRDVKDCDANVESIVFDDSTENEQLNKRSKRDIETQNKIETNNQEDMNIVRKTFNVREEANRLQLSKAQLEKNVQEDLNVIRKTLNVLEKANKHHRGKRQAGGTEQCDRVHLKAKENKNRLNKIRNKRSVHPYGHDEVRCEQFLLKREKRDPRFRKDRLPTKKKKRTTCPFFARPKLQYNCTACATVFSVEGKLEQHEWKKHNGSANWVSYDTKDIEDEYYTWEYHAFDRNDTVETTREKWEKRCLVPNQKRHRFMNKGCTARYRPDQDGGGGENGGANLRKKRDLNSVAKRNIRGAQRHSVAKQAKLDERSRDVHQRRKRRVRIEDSEGNPVTKFEPEVEEILNGKFEARQAKGQRRRRDVHFEDLTDELDSLVRDPKQKYCFFVADKSWEWRIKNVNVRDYMYKIMEQRMHRTPTPPDAVFLDRFGVSNEKLRYPSYESRNRRVEKFYEDNGPFSGRTGSDMEIYMDSHPHHLPEHKEVVSKDMEYGKDYLFKPKPDLFKGRYKKYTNVKPGAYTFPPKDRTTDSLDSYSEVGFTDKKDYYDSNIELAKSQFRFRRDLHGKDNGQYSMIQCDDSHAKTMHRRRRGIEYDSDYSSNLQQMSVVDTAPELFSKLYPNLAVYTPYTFYPTTEHWLTTDPSMDPEATHPWVERSGPDSLDRFDAIGSHEDPLVRSCEEHMQSEMASGLMAKQARETIDPEDYQDWLEWQRNRSLEDQNSYHQRVYTCRMPACTFNASVEADVGDHIFIHHFTYPTNYKEAMDYHIETSTLGWERLTDVNELLRHHLDPADHKSLIEEFNIFTGLWDEQSFPTVHPNFTIPSKRRRTPYVEPTDPDAATFAEEVHKKTSHHPREKQHKEGHHKEAKHHTTRSHQHTSVQGHVRHRRGLDSELPPMPPDSNETPRSSREDRDRGRRRRFKRADMPRYPAYDMPGYDGPAFLKTGEELSDLTERPTGTTVWDFSSWQSEYEPNETRWTFSEETVPPKFRCKYCGDLFHEETHLLEHKSSAHPRKKPRTTTPCIRAIKKFFTLDSELDMSKNYDFVFSDPDNGSFVQHRPILEDSFYQSFDAKDPDHNVNSASYREINDYMDWVFNRSSWSICNACGKNISDVKAEAHFRKHVSNIKKDYFDELPPEYMDRCWKEAHYNESWETMHHKLKRQYEEQRIAQSIFEPDTYRCNRCNTTFPTHEKTYAHLLEHKFNDSRKNAKEAAIRTKLKREREKKQTTLRPDQKNWNPEYIDYLKNGGRMKRAVDAIEIDYPVSPNSNHSVPLYKLYESFNNSDERIENITPEPLPNIVTVVDDSQETNGDKNVQKSIDSNSTDSSNNESSTKDSEVKPESGEHIVADIPDYYFNVNEKSEDDNNSEEEEDSSDVSDSHASGRYRNKKWDSNTRLTLEELVAKMKQVYRTLTSKNILNANSTLLTRIEKFFGKTNSQRKTFLDRIKRGIPDELYPDYCVDNSSESVMADRYEATEFNMIKKLEKRFNTTIKDKPGHKLLETDVSRLIDDFMIGKGPNLTSEENRKRLYSFRECMKILNFRETRSEQEFNIEQDDNMEYMRLRTESPTLSPSEESLLRSKPREEYSDYGELTSDRWQCFECNATFENYTAFLTHMKKPKEPKWPYLIDVENNREKASIEKMMFTKSYWVNECYECGKHFNTRQELIDHINSKGYESLPHIDDITQSVKCRHCDLVYTNVQKYLEHRVYVKEAEQRLKHMTNKEFCGDCKKYFDTPEDYLHHLNEERRVDYEEMKKYPCKICNFTYLDSITLSLHMQKIHPEEEAKRANENPHNKHRRRRSCRIELRETVNAVPHHENYQVIRHIVLKAVNERRRKRRSVDYERKVKRTKMNKRRKRDLKNLMAMRKQVEERKHGHKCQCHAGGRNKRDVGHRKEQTDVDKPRNCPGNDKDQRKEIDARKGSKLRDTIINKRKKRGIDELMDKMDKEHEKYQMFNWNPEFNIKHPILMHEEYRQYYFQGLAEQEKHLQLQKEEGRFPLLGSRQAGHELVAPGMELEEDVNTYAFGPALFGTTWSYNQWPTIRYNILAPGKSYNTTEYLNRYYRNQTVKNHIKAIFRDYFAKPFNHSVPVRQFREPERDTEEFESLERKERRRRSAEAIPNENKDVEQEQLVDNWEDESVKIVDKHGIRNKRHYIDKACFHEKRERPNIVAAQQQQPLTAHCGCRAHRNRRDYPPQEVKIDIMNNNTIQKINWEKLAKVLIAENRNLSHLLDKHMTTRTTPIRKYECRVCGDRLPSLQSYAEHIAYHEKEVELEKSYPEEFNITCDHCYQIFSTEDAIHEHHLERMRILKMREAEDYVKLNRTTRRKIFTPFEDPFTIPIMENAENTWWNPESETVTEDLTLDRYYCHYCKDLMSNTKEFVDHRKFHETSRKEAKAAYLARKEKLDKKIREEFSVEGSLQL